MEPQLQIMQEQMVVFLTLLAVGYLAKRIGLLSDAAVDAIPQLVLHIILPVMLLTKLPGAGSRSDLPELGLVLLGIFCMLAVQMLFAYFSGKLLRLKQPTFSVHLLVSALPNSAFVGYPLLFQIFPRQTALFMVPYMIADTVMIFCVTPWMLSAGKQSAQPKWKALLTPTNAAMITALVLLLLELHPSGKAWDTLAGLGGTSQYFALIYIGADIARRGVLPLLKRRQIYAALPFKLILAPICAFWLLRFLLPIGEDYVMMISIMSFMPSMVTICMQAKEYGSDDEYAAAGLLVTTLASLVTMPMVMSLFIAWMGRVS